MRLVKVKVPRGEGEKVARIAFDSGIKQAAVHQHEVLKADGSKETKDIVDIETSTPIAKAFIDLLMTSDFYNPEEYSINIRQPRSIVSKPEPFKITWPLVEPITDIFEELWQFSHVTFGFIGRVLIASLLLAYGLIEAKVLIIIAGLLFMPLLPLLLAIGFGSLTRAWRLVGQAILAFMIALVLLVSSGVVMALLTSPPVKFNESNSLFVSFLISIGVGIAAGLATADDVGRREMIGLAATSQIAILPVLIGISFVFGTSPIATSSPVKMALTFVMNILTIIIAALMTYAFLGMRGEALKRITMTSKKGG